MDKQLIVKNPEDVETALMVATDIPTSVEGVGALGREDLSIPRLVLVQAQSKDVPNAMKHLGEWYNTLTGEFSQQFRGVMLGINMGRTAFERKYNSESDPLCASDDGIAPRIEYQGATLNDPDTGVESIIDGDCSICPFAKFGENGETPLCAKAYVYAMYDLDSGFPVIVRMQRTATKEARKINTVAKIQGNKKIFYLSSKLESGNSGQYYIPVFTLGECTSADILAECRQLSNELGNIAARVQRENGNGNGAHAPAPLTEEEIPF